jgi:uncharacterized coiled-coil protein SlyX
VTKLEIRIIDLVVDAIGKGAREWDAYAIPSPVPAVEAARLIMLAIAEDPDMSNDSRYIAQLNTRINLQEDRIEQLEAALYRIRMLATTIVAELEPALAAIAQIASEALKHGSEENE